ncbi:hypothetical protein BX600DRAFT_248224 [Xylariales sp. PMI_506]|nr:hypothetical protein BX600DRAFT_248224 [Xylariales sp. PMI_506]
MTHRSPTSRSICRACCNLAQSAASISVCEITEKKSLNANTSLPRQALQHTLLLLALLPYVQRSRLVKSGLRPVSCDCAPCPWPAAGFRHSHLTCGRSRKAGYWTPTSLFTFLAVFFFYRLSPEVWVSSNHCALDSPCHSLSIAMMQRSGSSAIVSVWPLSKTGTRGQCSRQRC